MSNYLPDGCTDEMCSSAPEAADDYPDYEGEDDYDEEEEWEFGCHMDTRGYCGAAGSEECEFECPYNKH